jgi:type VI secretion system secreted protein VgrG
MVTIMGTGFVPNSPTVVDFGPNPATGITVVSSTEITAFSPPGAGAVNVTVTTLTGSSPATPAGIFTYTADGPQVTNVQRFGVHAQPTFIVITFNSALDPVPAENVANYVIVGPGKHHVKVKSARYNPLSHSVTLALVQRLSLHKTYMLTINGTPPAGLKNPAGLFLDGAKNGQPGSNSVIMLSGI